jgi:hypothetical protein
MDFAVLQHLRLDQWKLGILLVVAHRHATHPPGFPSFLNSGVVDVTTEHKGTVKDALLLQGGGELVLVRLADAAALRFHTQPFCLAGGEAAREWDFRS